MIRNHTSELHGNIPALRYYRNCMCRTEQNHCIYFADKRTYLDSLENRKQEINEDLLLYTSYTEKMYKQKSSYLRLYVILLFLLLLTLP